MNDLSLIEVLETIPKIKEGEGKWLLQASALTMMDSLTVKYMAQMGSVSEDVARWRIRMLVESGMIEPTSESE